MRSAFTKLVSELLHLKLTKRADLGIPTVDFDNGRVTQPVRDDLWSAIKALPDIPKSFRNRLYKAALESISRGSDLHFLCKSIIDMRLNDMSKKRAADIARFLNNRATVLMSNERCLSVGITHAIWMYSGAPCEIDPFHPTGQDVSHRAVHGLQFKIADGILIDGKHTWPGREAGCKCGSKPMIPGFS